MSTTPDSASNTITAIVDPHARLCGAPGRHRGGAAPQRRRHAGAADAPCAARRRHPQRRQRLPWRPARCGRRRRLRAVQRAGRCPGQRAPGPAIGRPGLLVRRHARVFRRSRAAVRVGTGPLAARRGAAGADRRAARCAEPARADDGLDLPALRHPPGGRPHRLPGPLAHAAGRAQALRHAFLRHRGAGPAGGQPGRPGDRCAAVADARRRPGAAQGAQARAAHVQDPGTAATSGRRRCGARPCARAAVGALHHAAPGHRLEGAATGDAGRAAVCRDRPRRPRWPRPVQL